MASPRKGGVGAEELEQLVSSTLFGGFGSSPSLILAPPSAFDHDAPDAADAVVALDQPARSYLASTATLFRKALLTLTPRILKSPAPPARERTKSCPRSTFFRRVSVPKESLPPLPPLSRSILDRSDSARSPTPATPTSAAASNGSPSSRLRRRRRLASVFEPSVRIERETIHLADDEPPSPPPKSPRYAPPGAASTAVSANTPSISLSPPDLVWTPALTNASPAPSSPASSTRLGLASNVRRPITPINDGPLFDHGDDPFRKNPPSPMRSSISSSPPRPRAPRSKSTPRPYKIRPSPSPLLHPALTLASASATTLPYALTDEAGSRGSLFSTSDATTLLLPFPLPPDASQEVLSVRVSTPVDATFPPARPPPTRPLPKTPPESPWHPHATAGLKTLLRASARGSKSCSATPSISRSESREDLSTHAAYRPLPMLPASIEPPARRRRPSSPFPMLESTSAAGPASVQGPEGDVPGADPHARPPRAARHEMRAAVDAMLAGDVTFTNPWTSPRTSTHDMELHLNMLPDSDTEPELSAFWGMTRKKASTTSTSTVSSVRSTSSMATQSTVTNATTASPSTSPDTTSPYIPIVPLPGDMASDPLGLAARSAASWMHPLRAKSTLDAHNKPSASSCNGASAHHPPSSYGYGSQLGSEAHHSTQSRPVSMRRSESDAPARSYASQDLRASVSSRPQTPVAFPRLEPQPHTAPAHVTTFAQAERERGRHSPPRRAASPSPPSFLGFGRRRRSFLHLPAIPRISPLSLGTLGQSSERTEDSANRDSGSVWFD